MPRVLEATCLSGVVSFEGTPTTGVEILSKGVGASDGVLLTDKDKAFYLTSNASDVEALITKLVDSVTKINSILTAIGAGMTGATTAPPPTLAADILEVAAILAELNTLKGSLK